MEFMHVESPMYQKRVETLILIVSLLMGVDMAIMAMAAVVGAVFAALLYVHAMCLVLGFFKALMNDLVVSLLDKLTSSFESVCVFACFHFQYIFIVEPVAAADDAPESVLFDRPFHVQQIAVEDSAAGTELAIYVPYSHIGELVIMNTAPIHELVPFTHRSHLQEMVSEESAVMRHPAGSATVSFFPSRDFQEDLVEDSLIVEQTVDIVPAVRPLSFVFPLPIWEIMIIEDPMALERSVVFESEPVPFVFPCHIQEVIIVEETEEKDCGFLPPYVHFVLHSHNQTVHIEEQVALDIVPATYNKPAPKPVSPISPFSHSGKPYRGIVGYGSSGFDSASRTIHSPSSFSDHIQFRGNESGRGVPASY